MYEKDTGCRVVLMHPVKPASSEYFANVYYEDGTIIQTRRFLDELTELSLVDRVKRLENFLRLDL